MCDYMNCSYNDEDTNTVMVPRISIKYVEDHLDLDEDTLFTKEEWCDECYENAGGAELLDLFCKWLDIHENDED